MATDLAPVTPSVLKWARESIGVSLEDAAERARVSTDRVAAWEAGEAEPTVAKLRLLAKLYQRPLAVFFLPEPPKDFDALRDFRKLPDQEERSWSRALHKVYRRAIEQQQMAVELLEADGEQPQTRVPALGLEHDPEDAARLARRALDITLDSQYSWRNAGEAFAGWLNAVESLGVLVLRTSEVQMDEMRGFSLWTGPIPVIVVNALDFPRGQIFTMLHEFVHLMLRDGGLCNLREPDAGMARQIETFCNTVAGAILMPAVSLLEDDVIGPAAVRQWDDEVLAELSSRYGASREAVLLRLVTLDRASWDFYLSKRQAFQDAYAQARQEEKDRRREATGGPPPYRMAVRDRGRPYVRLVLDAYYRDAIGLSDVSRLLGLKIKHLGALEREARLR
jgi:Zn-dependent peptidase ImmA (M78 family)/transcriptional regulator with XRE-family HTH domain